VELTLAIETSSATYGVAVFDARRIHATRTVQRTDPAFVSIGELVAACVGAAGLPFDAISRVSVDLGPGNLGSVRAGVAYANGLGFSLGIPVVGVNSLRLLALTAVPAADSPVLCVRKSASGHVYAGLFTPDGQAVYRHGPHGEAVRSLAGGEDSLVLAGALIEETRQFLGGVRRRDSGVAVPDVTVQQRAIEADHHVAASPASPITEASPLFSPVEDPANHD
jgi:tRNA threonylcarbamoyl adenosine modification protein YeaZ